MIFRFLFCLFGFTNIESVISSKENNISYSSTPIKGLNKLVSNHFIRTSSFPNVGDRFMVSETLIATVAKINHIHFTAVFGVQCFFNITEEH